MNAIHPAPVPVVSATGVHRRYGAVDALAGVDIHVDRGEIVAILGPNGAGKTTLVEILEGLRRRDSGDVSVLGRDPEHAGAAWRSRIGAVLQLGTESDEFTVEEMLATHAAYYPNPASVLDVLTELGLADLANRRVRRLSGGQQRRLDIALGIIGGPELLFLDEPTTGLDAEVRRSIWQLIRRLADLGTTIVLTTHYLDEVEHLADRTLVLVDGGIVWSGSTAELRNRSSAGTITFDLLPSCHAGDLPVSLRPHAEANGAAVSIESDDPTAALTELMRWASSLAGSNPITNLQVGQRSLEDAYLALLDFAHDQKDPAS